MGWGRTAAYIAARAVLALATGGTSEAAFITADITGAAFAAYDVVNSIDEVVSKGSDLVHFIESAQADGKISAAEAAELLRQAAQVGQNVKDAHDSIQELRNELRQMGNRPVTGKEVMEKTKRIVRCSVCGAKGVNARSHSRGHAKAHLHNW
ncbi:hypothetical protein GPECTOR_176g223 [Gonium pectorale]|uniref:C2H2-type domain-containing protein n=1 Tax=Gonium pectorale TaxID=33097 RepID=A0A150FXA3_GONPE|nr:hypothetical protein GPECTOR_176g223 [Gonium pectorale]|eukprot:KXZ42242.1 hypothetical protein GPECTOR_176g223 [Gonium pectorale]